MGYYQSDSKDRPATRNLAHLNAGRLIEGITL